MITWLLSMGFLKTIATAFSAAIEVIKPLLVFIAEAIVWYVKSFWKGCGAIWDNPSVLAVLIVVFGLGGWYLKTWDNDKVLRECIKTCPTPVNQAKYYHPLKKKFYKAKEKITVQPTQRKVFKPFDINGG